MLPLLDRPGLDRRPGGIPAGNGFGEERERSSRVEDRKFDQIKGSYCDDVK